jgi:prepilin-type N-terminal cleavage/methylation domain-containing protein
MGHLTYVEGRSSHLDSLFRCNHDVPTMRWPARFRGDEGGFTLVELIIGVAIVGLLMVAAASALIVSLRTTGVTNSRLSESHDVQITSSYLANDMQSSQSISVPNSSATCASTPTTLVSFTYYTGSLIASYACGTANGETQVTRSFNGSSQILAHFAGIARPLVTCSPNPCTSSADAIKLAFTEASGFSYSLVGARRVYTSSGGGSFPPPQPALTLLATGSSPLYVQGGCKSGGANANCIQDPSDITNSLPISDVTTTNWTTAPLWSNLNDGLDSTWVVNNAGSQSEARVAMAAVSTPSGSPTITISVRANVAVGGTGAEKLTLTLYQGNTSLINKNSNNTFNLSGTINDYTYTLCLTGGCGSKDTAPSDYSNLRLGFAMSSGASSARIHVYGLSLDTAAFSDTSANGNPVLTVNGYLHVNSTLSNAVRLTGTKTATKLKIANNCSSCSPFDILKVGNNAGSCSGCTQQTVDCSACSSNLTTYGHFWSPLSPAIPDPLRFMAAPTDAGVVTPSTCPNGSTQYNPGVYNSQLLINNGVTACLNGGIYILKAGMKVNGGATVVGQRVLIYNDSGLTKGGITFNGGSNVQLTAYNSSPYAGILIFQARCPGSNPTGCANYNDSPINLTGGTVINGSPGVLATFLGVVYAPASTAVTLGSGGANMRVTAVIAQNLTVTGSSFVTIG